MSRSSTHAGKEGKSLTPLLEIFVAGVPAYHSSSSLLDYFRSLGPASGIRPLRGKKKGFYVLCTTCSHFKRRLLDYAHTFYGRSLQLSEIRRGEQLSMYNRDMNSRRVLVKKVPRGWSEEELAQTFDKLFGEVQSLFQYKSQTFSGQARLDRKQKHSSFSLLFRSADSATMAVAAFSVFLTPSVCIFVERYVPDVSSQIGKTSKFTDLVKYASSAVPMEGMYKKENNSNIHLFTEHQDLSSRRRDLFNSPLCRQTEEKGLIASREYVCALSSLEQSIKHTSARCDLAGRPSNIQNLQSNYRFNRCNKISKEQRRGFDRPTYAPERVSRADFRSTVDQLEQI